MEIDPAALSRTTTNPVANGTPLISTKSLPKASKPAQQTNPRVDLEPLYTTLKSSIGEHWGTYKDALSRFVLGYYNQEELGRRIDSFILIDPNREHLHNQLICGIYANILRDAPEAGVATWVSANDKPTSVSKPPTGDLAEQRLKSEVMRLPVRMRHRLKGIQDEPPQPLIHSLISSTSQFKPSPQAAGGAGASDSSAGLNKDLDIRRRYALPLISESHDLPASSALTERVLPICYEEGLPSGLASAETCGELLSTALENFVKEMITDIVSRTRSDAPISAPKPDAVAGTATGDERQEQANAVKEGIVRYSTEGPILGILTSKYKARLAKEEAAFARGEIKRSEGGLLPCELETAEKLGSGKSASGDLRIAWEMDNSWLKGMTPWLGEKIVLDGDYRTGEGGDDGSADEVNGDAGRRADDGRSDAPLAKPNGIVASVNGVGTIHDDPMSIDEAEWKWQGARHSDLGNLNSLLDDCLNVG